MVTPIALDIVAIIMALHGMAGGAYMSEGFIDIIFEVANWPSILFKLSPFDRPGYGVFDCLYPKVLIFNIVVWGLIGLFANILITKLKRPINQTDN